MPASAQVQFGPGLGRGAVPERAVLRTLLARAVRATLRDAGVRDAEVSLTVLDDAAIAELNEQYLAHEGPTDVLSFALYEEGEPVTGDVYIGFQQAQRQAESAGIDLHNELVRLAVHGTLHVLGWEHPEDGDRIASEMWSVQERIVAQVTGT
jgi:probable rRNA maturation factor